MLLADEMVKSANGRANGSVEKAVKDELRKSRAPGGIPQGQKMSIPVLTPTLGMVSMWWHTSIVDLLWPMNCGKSLIPVQDNTGSEIGEMRNRLIALTLAFEENQPGLSVPYVLWVDDDVIVNRAVMLKLLDHERPIVSGVYFCKGEVGNRPLIFSGPSSGTEPFRPDEIFESWGWAQGLSLVALEVYKRMRDELDLPKDKYGNPAWYKTPDFGVDDRGQVTTGGTEDFWFFDNASKLGYRPLVDCTKFAFGWHYDAAAKTGYPKPQWEQFIRREPIVWPAKGDRPEVVWAL